MVERIADVTAAWGLNLLAQVQRMPVTRLDPSARARLIGSLVLLTIGGVALVVLAWLALRVGRRHVARTDASAPRARRAPHPDDWARRPLAADQGADREPRAGDG